jgi:integrase
MGVFKRVRKHVVTWYVGFVDQHGNPQQERSGTDKTAAQRLLAQRKREVRDGTYAPGFKTADVTLAAYAEDWGRKRSNITADDDRTRLRLHILPTLGKMKLGDIQPPDVARLIEVLVAKGGLEPKSIKNVRGTLSALYRDAKFQGLVQVNPCTGLPRNIMPVKQEAEEKAIYEIDDVVALVTCEKIALDRRVFYALTAFTGMRHGEAAGRRWRHYDTNPRPLGALLINTQYYDKPLKSPDRKTRPRKAPVHPVLAHILAEWRETGFETFFGRPPQPHDFIVPSRRGPDKCRTVRRSLTNLVERDCPAAGVSPLTFHRFRDTFLSLCRRSGARKDIIERVTHNSKGDIVDGYTMIDWAPLCEAVLCLDIRLAPETLGLFPTVTPNHPGFCVAPCVAGDSTAFYSAKQLGSWRGGRDSKTSPLLGTGETVEEYGESNHGDRDPESLQNSERRSSRDARHRNRPTGLTSRARTRSGAHWFGHKARPIDRLANAARAVGVLSDGRAS